MKKKSPLWIVLPIAVAIWLAVIGTIGWVAYKIFEHTQTHISMTDQDWEEMHGDPTQGYGFPYENGWSSVDLAPYHVENKDNLLVRLQEPSAFMVTERDEMPILDGAEAAFPVYSAFALNCYENIVDIERQTAVLETDTSPIQFTNTIEAYKRLLTGEVDIFFGAKPSEDQKQLAESKGKELVLTPIGKEAFVFFVSDKNKVDSLTSDQIRGIYSGEYTNWRQVGGSIVPILAFQRPKNSGSQTMMEYFMGDTPLKTPLEVEWSDGMGRVLSQVANYQNKQSAIGYSFRYFATMMESSYRDDIKLLAIDGIKPNAKEIASGKYPLTTTLYAITVADNDNKQIKPFLEWMQSEQGQTVVEQTGYVRLDP